MSEISENNKRIAKNTIMLYMRMLFTMFVSLFTTRVVLEALGEDDYGLYNLVGAIIGMMGILTSLLSQGTSRFITMALGRGDDRELKHTFSASVTIHIILAAIIFIVGELAGVPMVNKLNISPDRLDVAHFVFQLSLISAVVGIVQSPYHAAIIAHEKMNIYAYVSIWDVIAKLLIVYLLMAVDMDKLKLYSSFYFTVSLITACIYFMYCRRKFAECRGVTLKVDAKLYKDIWKYTGWNAIGSIAFTMNGQGVTILLNMFGTVVIAARGIAGSISNFVYSFVSNFQSAARPQIMKLCSVNDLQGMNNLIMRTSKFSSYLIGLMGIPLFIEMDYVLQLWLKEVPEYTVTFARLTLIQGIIQAIDFPIGAGIHAVGKMKLPNITSAFIYMAILPISYVGIKLGASPAIAYVMIICVYPLALFMDLYIIHKYASFPVKIFIRNNVFCTFVFIIVTFLLASVVSQYIEPSFLRLVVTTSVSSVIFIPVIYSFGLTEGERSYIQRIVLNRLSSVLPKTLNNKR